MDAYIPTAVVVLAIVAAIAILWLLQSAREYKNSADYHKRALAAHLEGCDAYSRERMNVGVTQTGYNTMTPEEAENILSD